jgi:endonuclease-3
MEKILNKVLAFLSRYKSHKVGRSFPTLIECILSQRTRESNSARAAKALLSVASTPQKVAKMPLKEIERLIRPAGTYRQKARYIKEACQLIVKKYKGEVPKSRDELLTLPGVGPKTADVVLCYGLSIPAIAVDVHVSRISRRLGLVEKNDNVEIIRKKLEKIFPKTKWHIVNYGMVQFGRNICRSKPLCIKNKKFCPFYQFCKAYRTKQFNDR